MDRAPGLDALRGSTGFCDHVRAVVAPHIDGLGHGGVRYGGALFQNAPSPWADVSWCPLQRSHLCHCLAICLVLRVPTIVAGRQNLRLCQCRFARVIAQDLFVLCLDLLCKAQHLHARDYAPAEPSLDLRCVTPDVALD